MPFRRISLDLIFGIWHRFDRQSNLEAQARCTDVVDFLLLVLIETGLDMYMANKASCRVKHNPGCCSCQ